MRAAAQCTQKAQTLPRFPSTFCLPLVRPERSKWIPDVLSPANPKSAIDRGRESLDHSTPSPVREVSLRLRYQSPPLLVSRLAFLSSFLTLVQRNSRRAGLGLPTYAAFQSIKTTAMKGKWHRRAQVNSTPWKCCALKTHTQYHGYLDDVDS